MSAIEIRGIDHVVLRVTDVAAALRFYCDVLGCSEERRLDELATRLSALEKAISSWSHRGHPVAEPEEQTLSLPHPEFATCDDSAHISRIAAHFLCRASHQARPNPVLPSHADKMFDFGR